MKSYIVEFYFSDWTFAGAEDFKAPEGLDVEDVAVLASADYTGYQIDSRDVIVGGIQPRLSPSTTF
tara:strand:- start:300 stop:497 length:198 start_codon:yes stop_codon:yes gene_type:complete